jgi:hypothetical protein
MSRGACDRTPASPAAAAPCAPPSPPPSRSTRARRRCFTMIATRIAAAIATEPAQSRRSSARRLALRLPSAVPQHAAGRLQAGKHRGCSGAPRAGRTSWSSAMAALGTEPRACRSRMRLCAPASPPRSRSPRARRRCSTGRLDPRLPADLRVHAPNGASRSSSAGLRGRMRAAGEITSRAASRFPGLESAREQRCLTVSHRHPKGCRTQHVTWKTREYSNI